ncbi:MAG: arylsulfatase [Saprospiraceae bacterium]|nr:arylsulfatase [Saprospiraceae bacterium]
MIICKIRYQQILAFVRNQGFLLGLFSFIFIFQSCNKNDPSEKPNIIYILADDLGYGELGAYGQEIIKTPHIDALSEKGMIFTQHYSGAPVCAPARCVLLTGQHSGHAYVRGNDEWGERGKVWDYQAMSDNPFLEGQRPLPDSILTVAEMLQEAGYRTGMVGKWGLGAPTTEGVPNRQGFDFFYGYNCQRQAHTYYPMHLWKNEERDELDNKYVKLHANLEKGADPHDINSYDDFNLNEYAPELMHDEALKFIKRNKEDPFFLYYASPIPHLPLQAPQKWVDYYHQEFGEEEPFTGTSYFPCRYPRATYAAMISYLDEQVGELVSALRQMGQLDNTLIIFSSDNGPTYTGGADTPFFDSARPFRTEYGWGKGFTHEGGIRVPMIAHWPDIIQQGSRSDHISAFQDVYPTLCEIAGIEPKVSIDGISFYPELRGDEQEKHDFLFWDFPEYGGQQAVRKGDWKAIRKDIKKGNMDVELYDLSSDVREENNIADQHPEVVEMMEEIMKNARTEPVIDRFKMESLGDVKNAVIDARRRVASIEGFNIKGGQEYFTIDRRSTFKVPKRYASTIEKLLSRLEITGGYKLNSEDQNASIEMVLDETLSAERFILEINNNGIQIKSGGVTGFERSTDVLLSLMDPRIHKDFEMHNPAWTIAGGTIKS